MRSGSEPAEEAGIDALYAREREPMLRLAYLIVGATDIAEDVVHDSFLEVQRRFAAIDNPGGYLRRTVINRCLSWQRRQKRERGALERWGRQGSASQDAASEPMWLLLGTLPARTRAALVLVYYLDLTSEQAAEHLGCRPATVRSMVHRGLATLRKEWS